MVDAILEIAQKEAKMIEDLWEALHSHDYARATAIADRLAGKAITIPSSASPAPELCEVVI